MIQKRKSASLFAALVAGIVVVASEGTEAQAQRGPAFMNSPGYQRALVESRKQRQQLQPPHVIEERSARQPRPAKRKGRPR